MKLKNEYSAIILAGGNSKRMNENKALLTIDGIPLIQRIIHNLEAHFNEIIISAQSPKAFKSLHLPYSIVGDKKTGQGPLMGILCGLEASSNPFNFVIACDIPDIDYSFLNHMKKFSINNEIVVPICGINKYEPLFAFYHKDLIPRIKSLFKQNILRVIELYKLASVKTIPFDPNNGWYFNLNNKEDFQKYLNKVSSSGRVISKFSIL